MHMLDTLVAPVTGIAFTAGTAATAFIKSRKMENGINLYKLSAVSALVFALQMINFPIPFTGSSGHFVGAILLAALFGEAAGFLSIGAILLVQATLFSDGGMLAFGCNWFNMGVIGCLVAYPLIVKPLTKNNKSTPAILAASFLSSVAALQLGAFSVVLQSTLLGGAQIPFGDFLMYMQPIHLAISLAEAAITAGVFLAVSQVASLPKIKTPTFIVIVLAAASVVCALSVAASSLPDGLEWSLLGVGAEQSGALPSLFAEYSVGGLPGSSVIAGAVGSLATFLFAAMAANAVNRSRSKNLNK